MDERLKYLGVASGISGWLVILAAIMVNPWFVFTEDAFSDLGGRLSAYPWVFNNGMMFTGLLIMVYGVYLTSISLNQSMKIGSWFTVVSGLALFLIGLYPTGTSPHFLVSVWFFGQTDLAIGAWGLGLRDRFEVGWLFLVMSVMGPIGAILVPWPSTAVVEAYGIVLMNIWVVLMTRFDLTKN